MISKRAIYALLFSIVQTQTTSDLALDNTLQGCLTFASQFDNTCTDTSNAPSSLTAVPTVSVTCSGVGNCPDIGSTSGDNCTWTAQLCVSCRESNSKVYVRTQTNGLPNHCYVSPMQAPVALNVDYEARWMPPVSGRRLLQPSGGNFTDLPNNEGIIRRLLQPSGGNSTGPPNSGNSTGPPSDSGNSTDNSTGPPSDSGNSTDNSTGPPSDSGNSTGPPSDSGGGMSDSTSSNDVTPTTQDEVNSLICNIMRSQDSNMDSVTNVEFTNTGSSQHTAWGVSTTGVMYYNGISGEGVDPIFPAVYGSVTNAADALERSDSCFGHPGFAGDFHYHSASPCQADTTWDNNVSEGDTYDHLADIRTAWESKPYRSVAGLSKDGRPIYGPYHGNKQEYTSCEVDVCNGMTINGEYAYVVTMFHPYIQGCYGPGNMPDYSQQCSSNPRNCNSLTDFSNTNGTTTDDGGSNNGGNGPPTDGGNSTGPPGGGGGSEPGTDSSTVDDIISVITGASYTKSTLLIGSLVLGMIQI